MCSRSGGSVLELRGLGRSAVGLAALAGRHRGALLLDLGSLTRAFPQVVELGPPDVAPGHDLDLGDDRRVDRERPLDADAEADLPHRERLARPGTLAADNGTLEDLDPLAVALHDPHVHLEGVAGRELRDVVAQAGAIDDVGGVHGADGSCGFLWGTDQDSPNSSISRSSSSVNPPRASMSSGRRSAVRASACARRQRAIRPWSPERSTSGTSQPRKSAGRVYCGYSSSPS